MKSYELIVETLNKQNIKKQIVIPDDFTEKKIWRLVMKEFVTYGKKHGYNPMGEVITHIMTGKYKSKTLTKDDKLMLGILEKDILSKTKTQENIIRALSARRAMDEFWKKKEEEEEAAPTTKVCPFCKSEIPVDAVKCAHCTSDVSVVQ